MSAWTNFFQSSISVSTICSIVHPFPINQLLSYKIVVWSLNCSTENTWTKNQISTLIWTFWLKNWVSNWKETKKKWYCPNWPVAVPFLCITFEAKWRIACHDSYAILSLSSDCTSFYCKAIKWHVSHWYDRAQLYTYII